jgi:hypothetical protein
MSMTNFNSSSMAVPGGQMNTRLTEVSTEGGAVSGDMRWRFNSSANHYFQPRGSYVQLRFEITKGAGLAIEEDDDVLLAADPGAAMWSTVAHQINGVQCGQSSNPAQDSILYKKLFMKRDVRESIGGIFSTSENSFVGTQGTVMWQPPLGLYNSQNLIGGQCEHVLSATLHTDLAHRIIASSAAALPKSNIYIRLISAKLFTNHTMPTSVIRPPKTLVIPTVDFSTNSQVVNSNGSSTLSYTVPPSTRRIIVSSQLADLRSADARGATFLGGTFLDNLHVDYASQQQPALPYNGPDDTPRKCADLYAQALLYGESTYDSLTDYAISPITGHLFSKSPEDVSTTAVVRFSATSASAAPSSVFCTAIHYNSIVLQHDASGVTTGVSYMTVN